MDPRCIKTTLGMQTLSCRTLEMAMKELRISLLAYNVVRDLTPRAALLADVAPRSLKHAVQL